MRPNADAVTRTPGTTTINSSVCVFTKPMTSVAPSPSAKISPCISRILYLHGHRHQKYLILADVVSALIDPAMMKRTREKPASIRRIRRDGVHLRDLRGATCTSGRQPG